MATATTGWTGKSNIQRLYVDINKYVLEYTSEHQSELNSYWFETWYDWFQTAKIGKPETTFHQSSFLIMKKSNATPSTVLDVLVDMIPSLQQHINISNTSMKGNVKYSLLPYGFSTPSKKAAVTSQLQQDSTNMMELKGTTNPYATLEIEIDSNDDDNNDDEVTIIDTTTISEGSALVQNDDTKPVCKENFTC